MKNFSKFWPFVLIFAVVLLFFLPIFKGYIPFPGDLLVNTNPYKEQSYLGFGPGAYPNKAQGPDVIYEIYPWRYFSVSQVKLLEIPFWNPYNFSGNPQMADFQTAIFYPINLIYLVLPFNISWTLIIMLQPLLAGIFMYLFLKKGLGLKDVPSVIGGISFGFSSYFTVWIEYGNIGSTFLWLPLVLLFVKKYFNKLSVYNFLGIVIPLIFAILAGYIQGAFYIYALSFAYYAYLVFSNKGAFDNHKKNFLFLISLFLPLAITAFQILPTLLLFSQSTREGYSLAQIEKNLSPLFNLVTIFVPDFFGNPATRNYWIDGTYIERVLYPGTIILFFAFYAILNKINLAEKKFFVAVSVVSLIIATNLPFIKFLYLIPIPIISTTVATREFCIFIFSVIVLGSVGIDHFISSKDFKKRIFFIYAALFETVWSVVFVLGKYMPGTAENLKITQHNLIIPTVLLYSLFVTILLKKKSEKLSLFLITALLVFDLFYFFNKITPFSPAAFTYPTTPVSEFIKENAGIYRFWGYGSAYIPANFQTVDKTFSPEGNDPLHLTRYSELLSSSANGAVPKVLPRPDANIAPGFGPNDLKDNFYRKRVLDLLGVKYILDKRDSKDLFNQDNVETFPKSEFSLAKKTYPWQIFENKNTVPRFFITGNYLLAKDKPKALSFIYNPNINLTDTVILENHPDIVIDKNSNGTVSLLNYKPNQVKFSVKTTGNTLLFLSDNFYSEWGVKIDGKEGQLLEADYAFRAVAVPKGNHTVYFYYKARIFNLGLAISFVSLLTLFAFAYYVKKNNKKH